MNPRLWNQDKIKILIRKGMRKKSSLKQILENTPKFGGLIELVGSITGSSLVKILTYIIQLIFGIEVDVNRQNEMLAQILEKNEDFDLRDKEKYGWTATPTLV